MKVKRITPYIAAVLATGVLTFTSCKKKEKEVTPDPATPDTEQSSATDFSTAESISNDIESMASEGSENSNLTTFKTSGGASEDGISAAPCATVFTNTLTPKSFTIDFGTTGCLGADGRTRTGKLVCDFSASATGATRYRNPGFSVNISSQNYVVDNYTINITNKTITNTTPTGAPNGTNLTWSIAANISILKPGGGTITWACSRTKELTNTSDTTCYTGQANPIRWGKAIIKINGSTSGTNAGGESYTSTATNLVRDFNCSPLALHPQRHPFISGTLSYTPGTRATRLINYGSGACDMLATITISGVSYNFVLP